MMMKLKSESLGRLLRWPVQGFVAWAKRKMSPPLRVKLTRQSLMISLPASQGGRLHILPRPGGASGLTRTFEVLPQPDGKFALKATPDDLALAAYETESEAALALATLNKALTGSVVWKWSFRLFVAWIAWLFVTSYMAVSQQSATANSPDALSFGQLPQIPQGALPNIPAEPAAFQSIPSAAAPDGGNLSDYIFQQAKKAQQQAQKDAQPPKVGADNAAGLEAFGLKGAASGGSGEGCDPKLAFKVPQK